MSGSTRRDPVYAIVQGKLRDFVRREQLSPGQRLPSERDLANRLGVSRTSLRQALAILRVEGLVDIRHGDGIYLLRTADDVIPPIAAELSAANPALPAVGEVRNALEGMAARWAALRRTDQNMAAMVDSLRHMEAEIADGQSGIDGDRMFHSAIWVAASNHVLYGMLEAIREGSWQIAHASLSRAGQPGRSLSTHRMIFDAIVVREGELASRLMFDHLDVTGEMSSLEHITV